MTCLAGASWVRTEILEQLPNANLRVYAVWLPFLGGSFDAVDPAVLPDDRVVHVWDEEVISSDWFGGNVVGGGAPSYDYYLLFGPDADWPAGGAPPLAGVGSTIIGRGDQLVAEVTELVAS